MAGGAGGAQLEGGGGTGGGPPQTGCEACWGAVCEGAGAPPRGGGAGGGGSRGALGGGGAEQGAARPRPAAKPAGELSAKALELRPAAAVRWGVARSARWGAFAL